MKWCSQCAQDDIRDTDFAHWHWHSHSQTVKISPSSCSSFALIFGKYTVHSFNLKYPIKRNKKGTWYFSLAQSRRAAETFPKSPSLHLMNSCHPEVLIHVQKSELQGFTSCSQQTCKAPHHTETLQIQHEVSHGVWFSGKSSIHWHTPYPSSGLVAQCSLNLGKNSNQAGKAEVWSRTDTRRQDPAPAVHFSVLSILLFQSSTITRLNLDFVYWFSGFFFLNLKYCKFRVTLFFKENFWKNLHFKLFLNIGQAIPHLHNETHGGLSIWEKNHTNKRLWEVFSDIFQKMF